MMRYLPNVLYFQCNNMSMRVSEYTMLKKASMMKKESEKLHAFNVEKNALFFLALIGYHRTKNPLFTDVEKYEDVRFVMSIYGTCSMATLARETCSPLKGCKYASFRENELVRDIYESPPGCSRIVHVSGKIYVCEKHLGLHDCGLYADCDSKTLSRSSPGTLVCGKTGIEKGVILSNFDKEREKHSHFRYQQRTREVEESATEAYVPTFAEKEGIDGHHVNEMQRRCRKRVHMSENANSRSRDNGMRRKRRKKAHEEKLAIGICEFVMSAIDVSSAVTSIIDKVPHFSVHKENMARFCKQIVETSQSSRERDQQYLVDVNVFNGIRKICNDRYVDVIKALAPLSFSWHSEEKRFVAFSKKYLEEISVKLGRMCNVLGVYEWKNKYERDIYLKALLCVIIDGLKTSVHIYVNKKLQFIVSLKKRDNVDPEWMYAFSEEYIVISPLHEDSEEKSTIIKTVMSSNSDYESVVIVRQSITSRLCDIIVRSFDEYLEAPMYLHSIRSKMELLNQNRMIH